MHDDDDNDVLYHGLITRVSVKRNGKFQKNRKRRLEGEEIVITMKKHLLLM